MFLSYSTGMLPSDWKQASVTPIYKGSGFRNSPENYRPISLTPVVSKVMESIISSNIHTFLADLKLINPCQHGFLPGRSTTSNLLSTFNDWSNHIDISRNVDCIYLDLSKAFDFISHKLLLLKLPAYGLSPKTVSWISAFLYSRSMHVAIPGGVSKSVNYRSGVP
jgi:hypothetical protein